MLFFNFIIIEKLRAINALRKIKNRVKRHASGGVKGSRTLDLYNAIVALYQLSYDPNIL